MTVRPVALLIFLTTATVAHSAYDIVEGEATAIDGETVEVDGTRIVLQGLDAPPLDGGSGRLPFVPETGYSAYLEMANIVGWEAGGWLRCVVMPAAVAKERRVGSCRSPKGLDPARELIRRGKALACARAMLVYAEDETFEAQALLSRSARCAVQP